MADWMIATAPGLMATWDLRACRGGKSGLRRARWWVTPTARLIRVGKVPQKTNRHGVTSVRRGKGETVR